LANIILGHSAIASFGLHANTARWKV